MVLFLLSSKHTKVIYDATSQDGACEKGVGYLMTGRQEGVLSKAEEFVITYKCEFGIYVISRMYDSFNQQVDLRHLEGEGKEGGRGRGRGEKMGGDREIKT